MPDSAHDMRALKMLAHLRPQKQRIASALEEIVDEPGVQVAVEHAVEGFGAVAAVEFLSESGGGVAVGEGLGEVGVEELGEADGIEGAEPGDVAFGGVGEGEVFEGDAEAVHAGRVIGGKRGGVHALKVTEQARQR